MLGKGLTQSLGSFTLIKENDTIHLELNGVVDEDTHFFQPALDNAYKFAVCGQSNSCNQEVHIHTIPEILTLTQNGL